MLILRRNFVDDFLEDFFETGEDLDKIELSLPGVGKDNIDVYSSKKGQLTVKWKTKDGDVAQNSKRTYSVIPFKEVDASYVDGVLRVNLVPEEEAEPVKIKIA